MSNQVELYTEDETQFYPTPDDVIDKMLEGIKLSQIQYILEPSAGKGNIVKKLIEKYKNQYYPTYKIDMIEMDENLKSILKNNLCAYSENCSISYVWDDFLTYEPYRKYDLIIMNPPFRYGLEHLIKALRIQKDGGQIICILNAETIKNPYSYDRKLLLKKLNEYNADIQFYKNSFGDSERKTDVEIAIVKVNIPQTVEESEWWNNFTKAEKEKEYDENEKGTSLIVDDFIKQVIQMYNIEIKSGLELFKHYNALKPHLENKFKYERSYDDHTTLCLNLSVNQWLEITRMKYWKALFSNPEFTGKLTSDIRERYRRQLDNMREYEFNEFNIESLIVDMNANIKSGVENAILKMFDTLTREYSYYPECSTNKHYYDGWKTNIAHKINDKKVILLCGTAYDDIYDYKNKIYNKRLNVRKAIDVLEDIEKCLNYLDGKMTTPVDLREALETAKENPKM